MSDGTILWHDYETVGRRPDRDRPTQFAAIRTDLELNEVESPVERRCRLAADVLPDPEACLVTGVVPGDRPDAEGSELEFARCVLAETSRPATCTAGYNSIRFDDEVTRYLLWRNLLPVYDREWRHGNCRFDLIDALRAAHALRPEGIEWPLREDGTPSFRLELLTAANGIDHGAAHDAVADVRATIEMARRLRAAQPRLWDFAFASRSKQEVRERIGVGSGAPIVHVSGRIGARFGCATVMVPVAVRAGGRNEVICVDLRADPEVLLEHDVDALRTALFTPRGARTDAHPDVGIKSIHLNRAPFVAPLAVLDRDATWARIQLDPAAVEARAAWVHEHATALGGRLQQILTREPSAPRDCEQALYDGLPDDADVRRAAAWHRAEPAARVELEAGFVDARFRELAFRLRAREWPETLDDAERARWSEHVRTSLHDGDPSRGAEVRAAITALREAHAAAPDKLEILARVERLVDARLAAAAAD